MSAMLLDAQDDECVACSAKSGTAQSEASTVRNLAGSSWERALIVVMRVYLMFLPFAGWYGMRCSSIKYLI